MGMTIDEAMENLHDIQAYYNNDMQDGYIGFAKEDNESVDFAMDIMRKFQKIKNIICKWEVGIYDDEGLCHTEVLEMISDEVNGDDT